MISGFFRLLCISVIALIGLPSLLFGLLGVTGDLSDSSERENLHQGLFYFGVAMAAFAVGTFGLVMWKRPG